MFLTNLDAVIISLFLGSGIILMTLFGILLSFRFKYNETKILLSMFFNLVIFSIILLLTYGFILLFRWPGMIDFSIFTTLNVIVIWLYVRLF
jgi:membrane-bound ClpP family serine protease